MLYGMGFLGRGVTMQYVNHVMQHCALLTMLIVICSSCIIQSAFAGSIVGWGCMKTADDDLTSVSVIAAGSEHSLAIKSDGSLVGWGYNPHGQAKPPAGKGKQTRHIGKGRAFFCFA